MGLITVSHWYQCLYDSRNGRTSYRKISWSLGSRDSDLEFSNRSEIWQALRQQRCRDDHYNIQSRGFETLRDFAPKRLTTMWIEVHYPIRFVQTDRERFSSQYNDTWASWRLESPETPLFSQQFVQIDNIGIIKLRTTGAMWGESTSDRCTYKGPIMRKTFPCHDVIMVIHHDNPL